MLAWMSEIQPGEIPWAVMEWSERDLESVTTWLGAQDPSPTRDQTIARFATEASELDVDSAMQWANEIEDAQLREQTLRRVNNE